ncbi:MAG: DUF368 domain-containing protein [Pseudomonadota bacterium]
MITPVKPSIIKELLIGYCLGTANIIPGVSGGTFLLIFNIYERVFSILGNINKTNIIEILSLMSALVFKPGRAATIRGIALFLDKTDFVYLLKLVIGSVVAIVSLSSVMKYLIVYHFSKTYALFFGLILVSILIPVKMLNQRRLHHLLFLFLGIAATVYVSWAVNPYDKIEKKSSLNQALYQQGHGLEKKNQTDQAFSFVGKYSLDEYVYAIVCGAVSVSAMVLPGISGSLVLILMGEYFEVVSAIAGLKTLNLDNMAFLCCFAVGIVFGGLLFARLVSAVLKRYYNSTMAFLIGLMAGSLYALWPFKKTMVMARQYIKEDGMIKILENVRIYTNINELPVPGSDLYLSLLACLLGGLIMVFFVKKEMQE